MRFIAIDRDFIPLYDLELTAGRNFDPDVPSDELEAFILNEAGMRRLGWTNVEEFIGQELRWQNRRGRVIGVLKDFHYMSTNQAIQPFIVVMNADFTPGYISIKFSSTNIQEVLSTIESTFDRIMPNKLFEYSFLDEDFNRQYQAEERFMQLFTIFSGIAIFVACLGLYGLAAFIAQMKFKEIGVRKVLGASTTGLMILLNKEFSLLVAIASILAIPAGYITAHKWIQEFPYQVELNIFIFLAAGVLALIISWLTVSYQSFKAASANPVDSIGNE